MNNTSRRITIEGIPFDLTNRTSGISINDSHIHAIVQSRENGFVEILLGARQHLIYVNRITENEYEIWIDHFVLTAKLQDHRSELVSQFRNSSGQVASSVVLRAPMPGLVARMLVQSGNIVRVGDPLVILEAMKMENEIRSTINGTVSQVHISDRMNVNKGQELITIEPDNGNPLKERARNA